MNARYAPWNLDETRMAPNLLLAAKIIVIALLFNFWPDFPNRHNPFITVLDHVPSVGWRILLQLIFLVAAATLMFNIRVELSSMVLGVVLILEVLGSQSFFHYNLVFSGSVLFCIGLAATATRAWLVSAQVALLYFGAVGNKLRSPQWRSGVFLRSWSRYRMSGEHLLFRSSLPGDAIAKGMSWAVMATEALLCIAFVVWAIKIAFWPNQRGEHFATLAVLVGVGFHTLMYVITGSAFGVFVFTIAAVYLVFIPRPPGAFLLALALYFSVVTETDIAKVVLFSRGLAALLFVGLAARILTTVSVPPVRRLDSALRNPL